ncbi:DUF4743 domain-containing protein [Orrella sp. JC864]|uniref:DUF4743 domain-containing protein n=1 Tax=Orrella sp. JC864 TaxID=3120298 RepID=UPI0012BBE464
MPDHPLPATPAQLQALYARLCAAAQETPYEGSLPLWVAARRCGWATPAACAALRALPGVRLGPDRLDIGADLAPGAGLNALLAQAAQALRQAGCVRGWRNELLDVHPEDGSGAIGVLERAAMRPLGLLTQAVHLNAWTPDGRLWIARRALTKNSDPGMWDTLVGGLASSGETLERSLLRECAEEAGLSPADVAGRTPLRTILRMRRRLPEGLQNEDILTSTCVLAPSAAPRNQDGEVMEIRHEPLDTVMRMLEAGEFTEEAALVIVQDMLFRFCKEPA